jgi:WD40 repeat protein
VNKFQLVTPCVIAKDLRDYLDNIMLFSSKQVLRVMEYSRLSRHLLLTAGDDGTVHLWDTTSRSPKAGQSLSFPLRSFVGIRGLNSF